MAYHVSICNLRKVFEVTIAQKILSLGRILFSRQNFQKESHRGKVIRAVDGVSLEFVEGERIGVIGKNGAGKTTLLQMIAGLAEPTSGVIKIEGHVNCIMTLGIGLREELSGRENIYIDGEINGRSRTEINEVIDYIISFADLGEHINYPVKTYSTGMKSRLSFSMLIYVEPEILIIDEALSAGDAQFSIKASAKMKEICSKGKILILVSHSMSAIVAMCNRCIWMDNGKIVMDGDPEIVTKAYVSAVRKEEEDKLDCKLRRQISSESEAQEFEITYLKFLDKNGTSRKIFDAGEEMTIQFGIRCEKRINKPDLKISVERNDGILLLENYASEDDFNIGPIDGEVELEIPLGPIIFGKGFYEVDLKLFDKSRAKDSQLLAYRKTILKIEMPQYYFDDPLFFSTADWRFEEGKGDSLCKY